LHKKSTLSLTETELAPLLAKIGFEELQGALR
jgi:hypothetical protein